MDNKNKDLSNYRYELAFDNKHYKDCINRSYYAVFYAVKSVLALEIVDFKRHKDVVGYFNQNYVATEIFPKNVGKKLGRLQKKRETSDYDDFYLVSKEEAKEQLEGTEYIINEVEKYLKNKKF